MPLTASQRLTRSLGQRLSSALSRRRTGVSAETLLPIEIWDCVFHELPDGPLLKISTICRVFNSLCMPIYLIRKGIPPESLAAGDLAIPSSLSAALQLSLYTPPIECLSCQFLTYKVPENLASLRNLIRGSPSIRRLELIFNEDLALSHLSGAMVTPFPRQIVPNLFRDIVYAMAQRFAGPVVVVGWQDIFTCRSRDIRSWKIHQFHFCGGLRNYIRRPFGKRCPSHTTIRLHDGASADVRPISSISSVHVYDIPSITRRTSASSTLIVLNHQYITSLVLGYAKDSLRHSIRGAELTVVLPCITLPALYSITLNTDAIDPAVLSQFLARHKSLMSLEYRAVRTPAPAVPLITPTLALPLLTRVSSPDPANILRLLDALDTSPRLSNVRFTFDRGAPSTTALFRRLAQRSADAPLHLQLVLAADGSAVPLTAGERNAAASLACVRSVHLSCPQWEAAQNMLPWLALLPRLEQVDLASLMASAGEEDKTRFTQEVSAALAPAVEVLV